MSQTRAAPAGRKIRFRNLQAPDGFTPPEAPVATGPPAADDSALWGDSSSYNGTPDAPSGPEERDAFTLPSGGRKGMTKSMSSKALKTKSTSGKGFSSKSAPAADSPTKPPKFVRVAKPNPATGAVEWEDVEVRYGKPKVKPFALNCTFGLPRVLNKEPPLNSHQQAAQQNYNAQHHLPPISVTPDPSMRSSLQPKLQGSPSLTTVVSGITGNGHSPAGTVLARRQEYTRQLLAHGTASSDQRPLFVSITERKAEARRVNDGSFEAFVRPRSSFPASEQARKNVPPFASVARARRRHNTGDSSSDSDNEVDQDDLSERLQKLNQRRARLLRDMRRNDGSSGAGGRANQPDGWGSVNMRRSTIVADAVHDGGAADQTPPESTVDVSLSMIDYEIQWTKERLRRIRESEHEMQQQKQEQQLMQSQQRTSSPPSNGLR